MKIKLIYLAAGNSRRFSKNGKNKLLYKVNQKPMFLHLLERLVKICDRHPDWKIFLVTQYPEIEALAGKLPVTTVLSPESYKGASYSIKEGLLAAGSADAYAFFVADQPYFSEKSAENFLTKMEQEARSVPGCVRNGQREGNPVWFPALYRQELMELEQDMGGRKVFAKYREHAVYYEVEEKELEDLDYEPEADLCKKEEKGREDAHLSIYRVESGKLKKCSSLRYALGLEKKKNPRIAAVGAGGKTSLLKMLAREYKENGQKPFLITTTHMKKETSAYLTTDTSLEKILAVREKEGMVIAGADAGRGRIKSLPPEVMEMVFHLETPILVEADGARMLPVKVPAETEPVLPKETETVLSVYGLDAVGMQIREKCFRPELAAEILEKEPKDILTEEDIIRLAVSEKGGKKGLLPGMEYQIVLNKADDGKRLEMAKKIATRLEKDFAEKVFITSFW